jgi:hypothetical protein
MSFIFFSAVFLCVWLRIDPTLYSVAQEPFFQLTPSAIMEYLSYPGGIVDYLSAFFSQFFVYPLVGAFIITFFLFLISFFTLRLLQPLSGKPRRFAAPLFIAALCLSFHCNYYHPLSITIGLAACLAAFTLFTSNKTRAALRRFFLFMAISCSLYYSACGAFFLFALLCMLLEILKEKRFFLGLAYCVVAGMLPFIATEFCFLISFRDACLHLLPFGIIGYQHTSIIFAVYFFFPALLIAQAFSKGRFMARVSAFLLSRFRHQGVTRAVSAFFPVIVVFLVAFTSINPTDGASLRFCKFVKKGAWVAILQENQKSRLDNRVSNFAVAQALYHTGLLSTDLFAFPQNYGERGLFLFGDQSADYRDDAFFFLYRSELFLELGLVNESEQWGYEALSVEGETPWALKLLAQVHALKGEYPAALACLSVLETSPFHRQWAERFRGRLANRTFADSNETLRMARRSMPTTDFIRKSCAQPCLDLEESVRQNPTNRMTFEYCMASYMLLGNLPKIMSITETLTRFEYPAIPRLYAEAMAMLVSVNYSALPAISNRMDQETMADYISFNLILKKYNGDFNAAQKEILDKYWNTFWYYCFYTLPTVVKSSTKKQR